MEPNAMQIEQLKKIEVELLKEFVNVCEKLDLKYYLLEGTLLGAVRHKGFIPWDDDIDVGMPRADYERFCVEGQPLFSEHCFIQTIYSDRDYRANFAKIRDARTTFIETSVRHCDINHGIYIDVFPLDDCLDDEAKQKKRFSKQIFMNARISRGFYSQKRKRTLKGNIVSLGSILLYPTIRMALLARDKWMKSLPNSNTYANYCSAWYKKEIILKEWFGEGEYLEFEGLRMRAPKEYDRWLTRVYGDYMQLPPEEKRVAHHFADVIDPSKPYTFYRNESNKEKEKKL